MYEIPPLTRDRKDTLIKKRTCPNFFRKSNSICMRPQHNPMLKNPEFDPDPDPIDDPIILENQTDPIQFCSNMIWYVRCRGN